MTYQNAPKSYPKYLEVVQKFAEKTDCLAEQVEMFLFLLGQNLKRTVKKAIDKQGQYLPLL